MSTEDLQRQISELATLLCNTQVNVLILLDVIRLLERQTVGSNEAIMSESKKTVDCIRDELRKHLETQCKIIPIFNGQLLENFSEVMERRIGNLEARLDTKLSVLESKIMILSNVLAEQRSIIKQS